MKKSPFAFAVVWAFQGLWVFITTLPVTSLNAMGPLIMAPSGPQDYAGMLMMGAGFLMEVIADYQKTQFKAVKNNKNKFINVGLWSYSRPLNYFGEILLWFGVAAVASAGPMTYKNLSSSCAPSLYPSC